MNKWISLPVFAGFLFATSSAFAANGATPQPQPAPAPQAAPSAQSQEDLEKQLEQARAQLEAAAHRMAELSMQLNGPAMQQMYGMHMRMPDFGNRAILGITVNERDSADVKSGGVVVAAVTPGGPADKAGLQAGDVITSINGKAFKTTADDDAGDMLVDFMDGVKPGDALKVAYLRNEKPGTANVTAGKLEDYRFAFGGPVPPVPPVPPVLPVPPMPKFAFWFGSDHPWGATQLVPLTPGLGQYFGTDKGLLVVHAPKSSDLQLQDGDVILKIGGRDPGDPTHAMRILGSYGAGETLKIDIMRKGKPATLDVTLPKSGDVSGANSDDSGDDDTDTP